MPESCTNLKRVATALQANLKGWWRDCSWQRRAQRFQRVPDLPVQSLNGDGGGAVQRWARTVLIAKERNETGRAQ
jgi:hypothetical protein